MAQVGEGELLSCKVGAYSVASSNGSAVCGISRRVLGQAVS
jgi:hypothetical protein